MLDLRIEVTYGAFRFAVVDGFDIFIRRSSRVYGYST